MARAVASDPIFSTVNDRCGAALGLLRCVWRRPFFACAAILLLAALIGGCGERTRDAIQLSGAAQGTRYNITLLAGEQLLDTAALQQRIEQRLAELDRSLSNYRDDSDVENLNRAPIGEWIAVDDDLYAVLRLSMAVSWLSNGAFDVTVAPLVKLWGFGSAEPRAEPPTAAEIASARQNIGFQHLELDLTASRVRKMRAVQIDLAGVAQGYSVDALAQLLDRAGLDDYLVELGGELRAKGLSPRGTPWRIAIEQPTAAPGSVQQALLLSDVAVSTSGDYRDYFEKDGVRYSHTLDASTGRPIAHGLASVTVIHPECGYADALSTAIMVLGPERGLALAEQHQLAVYLIVRGEHGFETRHSTAFASYLER